jgi:hypothetical protein
MRLFIREGQYKLGIGVFDDLTTGVVIAFPKIILNVSGLPAIRFANADVSTQWGAYVNKETGKMDKVTLQIDWVHYNEHLIIPFNPHNLGTRNLLKKIGTDKRIYLVNSEAADESGRGVSGGTYAEISRVQILEWLKLEDEGKSVSDWSERDSYSYDI